MRLQICWVSVDRLGGQWAQSTRCEGPGRSPGPLIGLGVLERAGARLGPGFLAGRTGSWVWWEGRRGPRAQFGACSD